MRIFRSTDSSFEGKLFDVSPAMIDESLELYKITDEEYRQGCMECAEEVARDPQKLSRIRFFFDLLFLPENAEARREAQSMTFRDIFGDIKSSYATNVAFFSGCRLHKANMKNMGFDDYQTDRHRSRPSYSLQQGTGDKAIAYARWASNFVRCDIIEIGSLQYQRSERDRDNPETSKKHIDIHIPKNADLSPSAVADSLRRAEPAIKKYFGSDYKEKYCYSWLLASFLRDLLPEGSNILAFQNMFDILYDEEDHEDVLKYVFGAKPPCDTGSLPEDTSLQRKVKEHLLRGNPVTCGYGRLKEHSNDRLQSAVENDGRGGHQPASPASKSNG